MSKRSGQSGQVFLRHDRWVGRFYVDVPGQSKRVRKAVVLGMKNEITKSQAKLKLKTMLSDEGVNTPEHFERSLRPATTFDAVADEWERKSRLLLLWAAGLVEVHQSGKSTPLESLLTASRTP
jgi:hypothetical protein